MKVSAPVQAAIDVVLRRRARLVRMRQHKGESDSHYVARVHTAADDLEMAIIDARRVQIRYETDIAALVKFGILEPATTPNESDNDDYIFECGVGVKECNFDIHLNRNRPGQAGIDYGPGR